MWGVGDSAPKVPKADLVPLDPMAGSVLWADGVPKGIGAGSVPRDGVPP